MRRRLEVDSHRTKELVAAIGKLGVEGKALFVDSRDNENFAARLAQRPSLEARRRARRQRLRRARPRHRRPVRAGVDPRGREPGRRNDDAAGADPPAADHREVDAR